MRILRANQEYRQREQERNTAARQNARANPEYRQLEQNRDTAAHQEARANPEYRQREQTRNTATHQEARANPEFRTPERQRDQEAHSSKRKLPEKRRLEFDRTAEQQRKRRNQVSIEGRHQQFQKEIRDHPVHICPCCGRLMYINQTAKISLTELHQSDEFITSIVNPLISSITVNDQRFCRTCKTNILKGKVPRLALSNGLDFPMIPPEIQVRNNLKSKNENKDCSNLFLKFLLLSLNVFMYSVSGSIAT